MVGDDVANAPIAVAFARFAVISPLYRTPPKTKTPPKTTTTPKTAATCTTTCRLPARCAGGAASPPTALRGGSSNARAEPRHGHALKIQPALPLGHGVTIVVVDDDGDTAADDDDDGGFEDDGAPPTLGLLRRLRITYKSGATVRSSVKTDVSSVVRIVSNGAVLGAYARLVSLDGVARYRVAGGWLSDRLRGGAEKPVAFVLYYAIRGWASPRAPSRTLASRYRWMYAPARGVFVGPTAACAPLRSRVFWARDLSFLKFAYATLVTILF